MRSLILPLTLALALPMAPSIGAADSHNCTQLRQSVINAAPVAARELPYGLLQCSAISELHLLLSSHRSRSPSYLIQRIEAVFRREGVAI